MLRAIVFDVDGTLVDSVDAHARAWQEAFARFGKQLKFQAVREQIGKGGDQLMPHFLDAEQLERDGEALSRFRSELFHERYLPDIQPFPGVADLFRRLREDGKRVVLASSAKEDEVAHYVRLLGVEELLDGRTTKSDVERSKPHPDIFSAALRQAGVEGPQEALVVGDSPWDVEAASRIALRCVGVLCGGFSPESLRAAGAVALFQSPQELLARYAESPLAER